MTLGVLNECLNPFDFGTAEARNRPPNSLKEEFDSSSSKVAFVWYGLSTLVSIHTCPS